MTIGVLIPTLNEASHIQRAVESARRCDADQIIVCDGGSQDATLDLASSSGAGECLRCDPGRGVQLAKGLTRLQTEWVVILHADNWFDPDCLKVLDAANANQRIQWGGMRQRIESDEIIYRSLELGNAMRVRCRGMVFGDQAMFFRRGWIERVGGIPAVPLFEDVRISRQCRRHRWPTLLSCRVNVDARRWQRRGVCKQTWLNWRLQLRHKFGADEQTLADAYRRG